MDSAYKDAREVHRVDPKNNAIEPVLVRLHKAVSEKVYLRQIAFTKEFSRENLSIFKRWIFSVDL